VSADRDTIQDELYSINEKEEKYKSDLRIKDKFIADLEG